MLNLLSVSAPNVVPTLKAISNNEYDYQRSLFLYDSISLRMNRKDLHDNMVTAVPIHRDFLFNILGNDYSKIIYSMIDAGIIGRSESYQEGSRAKAMWIEDDFLISAYDHANYRTISDSNLISRFNRFYNNLLKFNPKYSHLQTNFDSINIDTDQVDLWIQNNYDENTICKRKAHIYKHSVGKIINQNIQYKRSKNGRLHSAMTVLKKELRPFLFDRNDGVFDFVEVDISNCQLCLLALYLLKRFPNDVKTKSDFARWGELCFTGQIYEYIAKRINMGRDTVKEYFMHAFLYTKYNKSYLLSSTNNLSDKEYSWAYFLRFIKEEFPTIWNKVYSVKEQIGASKFSIDLQRMESKLMIDRVLTKTKKLGTHFTIHDSIVCRCADREKVIELIDKESIKLFGIKLPLKDKTL
jgi:hypothetical protein